MDSCSRMSRPLKGLALGVILLGPIGSNLGNLDLCSPHRLDRLGSVVPFQHCRAEARALGSRSWYWLLCGSLRLVVAADGN